MKHWNKIRYWFIKDVILVILILLNEKVVKFCLIVFLINSRFPKVEGGLSHPELEEGELRPQATPHFYSTATSPTNVYNHTHIILKCLQF
jgi:hypothetical protein